MPGKPNLGGRPAKTTVDYFPHYTHNGKTIFTLESLYGNDGYAFWFKLLEILGSSDGHFFSFEKTADWIFLLAKAKVDEVKAKKILQTLVDLEAIDAELFKEKVIWCDKFLVGLLPVYDKRSTETPVKPSFRGENLVSGEETPQSKVKESKGEEEKEVEQKGKEKKPPDKKYLDFSLSFFEYLKTDHNGKNKPANGQIQSWAETIDKLVRLDNYSFEDEIKPTLRWAVKDEFWSKQVRSLGTLRSKSKNGSSKFQNIFDQFATKKDKTMNSMSRWE